MVKMNASALTCTEEEQQTPCGNDAAHGGNVSLKLGVITKVGRILFFPLMPKVKIKISGFYFGTYF